MNRDVSAKEYFLIHRPDSGYMRMTYARISRAFDMFCDISMQELCELPDKELKKVRRIGIGAQTVIREECAKYLAKQGTAEAADGDK
jgi:hypothetical protein